MEYESEFCDMSEIDSTFFEIREETRINIFSYLTQLNYEILEVIIRFNINKILQIYKNIFITYNL